MQTYHHKIFYISVLIITIGNIRYSNAVLDGEDPGVIEYVQSLPECSKKQPPCNECRKHVLAMIQQDRDTMTEDTPSLLCCSQINKWGRDCYSSWVAYDDHKDYMIFADSMAVLQNIETIWANCQSHVGISTDKFAI
ncbi:unnamed protein product [Cuscuta europaea]|uniref:Prolamin-like domain-containing protein n=1 Tax=Cuscuta europaea TaxID=41803 RepID=A0A9P1E419_CUSEU|nr:unnamed protein product [Cuscuta europaea]